MAKTEKGHGKEVNVCFKTCF